MNGHFENARQAIQAEAAEWVLQLEDSELDRKRREQLYAWLTSSPTHIDEFLLASAVWRELDGIDADKQIEIDQLLAHASDNVVTLGEPASPLEESTPRPRRWLHATWMSGLAATVAIVAMVFVFNNPPDRPVRYETTTGQQTLFTLADGSIVHLNTQSTLEVAITETERELTLLSGEAMFEVAKDPERPFRVTAGDVVVEAIGTAFNVYRHNGQVQVTVVEGEVKVEQSSISPAITAPVAPVRLSAGQEAVSNAAGEIAQIEAPDLEKRTAWREQRVVFREDALHDVAAEFNRYNVLQIVIEAPPSATRRITATFDAHDPQSFIAFLERDPALRVERVGQIVRVGTIE